MQNEVEKLIQAYAIKSNKDGTVTIGNVDLLRENPDDYIKIKHLKHEIDSIL